MVHREEGPHGTIKVALDTRLSFIRYGVMFWKL